MALSLQQHFDSRLPTEFLTDEDITHMDKPHDPVCFQHFPSHDFDSHESRTAEDEEEDFFADLTRRLTQHLAARKPESKWVVVGSPESTLSGTGTWSGSSNSSPNGVLSPPTTPFGAKSDTWGLIHEAAGEIARLKLSTEVNENRSFETVGLSRPDVAAFNFQHTASNRDFYGHVVAQKNQYLQNVRPEQVVTVMDTFATNTVEHNKIYKQQSGSVWGSHQVNCSWQPQPHNQFYHQTQTGGRGVWSENARSARPLGLPQSAWPPLQKPANQHAPQHHQHQSHVNSGLSPVTLGGPATRKCSGTGVFLPRGYANPSESVKKKSGSTVLRAKVVQALNSNFDDSLMNCHPHPRLSGAFAADYGTIMARRSAVYAQRRSSRPNREIHLPQEWTY